MFVGVDIELATVTWSEIDSTNGFIAVQVDALGNGAVDPLALSHPYGFASRPLNPEPKTGRGCCRTGRSSIPPGNPTSTMPMASFSICRTRA